MRVSWLDFYLFQCGSGTGALTSQLGHHVALHSQFLGSNLGKTGAGGESFRLDFTFFSVGFGWENQWVRFV